uniref:hypothetical protein n=1 Tax=Ningiella ruwaisensis TaxID=2364274 RepID=UPI0014476D40|nr:hypothetical protein [Ningiella ruwaisensis]
MKSPNKRQLGVLALIMVVALGLSVGAQALMNSQSAPAKISLDSPATFPSDI